MGRVGEIGRRRRPDKMARSEANTKNLRALSFEASFDNPGRPGEVRLGVDWARCLTTLTATH